MYQITSINSGIKESYKKKDKTKKDRGIHIQRPSTLTLNFNQ